MVVIIIIGVMHSCVCLPLSCSWLSLSCTLSPACFPPPPTVYQLLTDLKSEAVFKLHLCVSGLKMAAHNFIQLVKRLMGVFFLVVLTLSFLAVLGLQLFMGRLSQKCVMMPDHMTHHNRTSDTLFNPLYHDDESRSSFFDFNKYRDNPGMKLMQW